MKKGWILVVLVLIPIFIGCNKEGTIKVGASSFPHAEILRAAEPYMNERGYTLDIIEYLDYVEANLDLENRLLDANYFQHQPYLDNFNENNDTHLISVAKVHYEAFGIYPGKMKSLDELKTRSSNKTVKIAIPSDMTNAARALLLLEAQDIIKLKDNVGLQATIEDIVSNPYHVEIVLVEAAQIIRALVDYDFAVINGNYAVQGGFTMDDVLAVEKADSLAAQTYANVLVVYEGDETREDIKALVEVLKSPELSGYIDALHDGAVVSIN